MSRLYALLALLSALVVGTSLPCAEAQGAQGSSSKAAVACNHDDLAKLEGQALRVRRNEVFARHGRAFKSKDLQAHFARQSWYRVDPNFSSKRLSPQDNACVARVKLWEKGAFKKVATAQLDGKGGEDNVYLQVRQPREEECSFSVGFLDQVSQVQEEVMLDYEGRCVTVEVVDIDASDDRKELKLRYLEVKNYDEEDPPQTYTLLRFDRIMEVWSTSGGGISVNGNGTLTHSYSGGMDNQDPRAPYECADVETIYSMTPKFLSRGKTSKTPTFCAACPYVYVEHRGGERKVGEILRNLRSQELETTQSLQLLDLDGQPELVVRLAEEKDEITWLDATWLEVDGQEIAPLGCQSKPTANHCTLDQRRHRLARGDALELVFDTRGLSGPAKLWAHGYYIPFPTRTE